jgi:hypothetical protein
MPQNLALHSNSTAQTPPLPVGYDPLAGLSPMSNRDYRVANASQPGSKGNRQQEEEESDEVNILAVIIFGSLSVTALGGLGMLILLMFTTG